MNDKELKKYKHVYVRDIVKYLNGDIVIKRDNKYEYERCINIKKIIDIYDSDLTDYSKIYEISKIYTTYNKLLKATSSPLKYEDDEFLGSYVKKLKGIVSLYFDSIQNGSLAEVNRLMGIEDYFYSYDYAEFVLSSYLNYSDSVITGRFLDQYGIDMDTFNYCLQVVEELNPELYEQYVEKDSLNRNVRMLNTKEALLNIVSGIKTGYMLDGSPFDLVEFFKLFPFYDMVSSKEVLMDFDAKRSGYLSARMKSLVTAVMPEEYDTVARYMGRNNVDDHSLRAIDLKDIYNTKVIVNGREITTEDKDVILSFIKENGLPMVEKSYEVVRNKYLNGEIAKEDVKSKKYVPPFKGVLIP